MHTILGVKLEKLSNAIEAAGSLCGGNASQ